MRRFGSIFTATVCGLLSLYFVAAGAKSFYHVEKLEYVTQGGHGVMLIPKNGRLAVLVFYNPQADPGFTRIRSSPYIFGGTDYGRRILGFGGGVAPSGAKFVNIPFWFLALAFALPTALVVRSEWRRYGRGQDAEHVHGFEVRAAADGSKIRGRNAPTPDPGQTT